MARRRSGRLVLAGAMVVAMIALACGKGVLEPGGGGIGRIEAGVLGGSGGGAATGAAGAGDRPPQSLGAACSFAVDCQSGFCVDGVCCNSACTEPCRTCNQAGATGICVGIPAGGTPRTATACPAQPASTCGLDGKCDGAGGCRRHVAGTLCAPGTCDDAAVVGSRACDGSGVCRAGATVICVPYACNPATNACFNDCTSDAQCAGRPCTNGSCMGRQRPGACQSNTDCASGFCASGVCCNTACADPCTSCALPNRAGTCSPRPDCPAQDAGLD